MQGKRSRPRDLFLRPVLHLSMAAMTFAISIPKEGY